MTKKKNILMVLDETERSMIVESLHNYLNYHVFYLFFRKKNEKYHTKTVEFLENLKSMSGGFRLITSEDNLDLACEALRWNSKFTLSDKERKNMEKTDKYMELSYILENRNKNIYLFSDFDPKQYTLNTKLKSFRKFDFTQKRILIIRFDKGGMEFTREFYREPKETDEQYIERANKYVVEINAECVNQAKYNKKFLGLEYKAVQFDDLMNYKVSKSFSYHP
jgi:hypothetical protein